MSSDRVETVVVGSGFGGSVAAYRLAEAGRTVRVLERGQAWPPGSFPRTPQQMHRAIWDPSEGLHGIFDIWTFDHIDAVVASGLGGGSLIYANVLLRKDEHWFRNQSPADDGETLWPFSRDDLDPHYDNAEAMLAPQKLPLDVNTYRLDKTLAFKEAAERNGLDWQPVPLAVRFANNGAAPSPGEPLAVADYGNVHGQQRRTCTLCGECDVGCNEGAKNTLDHTYLSAAAHHGADIRTGTEVRTIAKRNDGLFEVGYVHHSPDTDSTPTATNTRQLEVHTVVADRVVMGAGALGSTYLLMKNRGGLPGLSPALGKGFCGNGDLLGFLTGARHNDSTARSIRGYRGPVITSTVRVERDEQLAYIQDAGFPAFMAWMVETTQVRRTAGRALRVLWDRMLSLVSDNWSPNLGRDIQRIIGPGDFSSSSMPLLGMGVDIADGRFALDDSRLACDWEIDASRPHFSITADTMRTISDALNADFTINPTWLFRRVVTVHALGGCPADHDATVGVVDAWGQAHGIPGLWVVDGAALPGAVGPNPSLTIAAFADRAAERMLAL